jgi:phosphate starvation-inducible PhoH-like protein
VTQVDLPLGRPSGLTEARQVLDGVEGIKFIEFDQRDVVRHALVQHIITAYGRWEQGKQERAAEAAAPVEVRS